MNLSFLPWEKDKWFSTQGTIIKYDKLEHLMLAVFSVFILFYIFQFELYLSLFLTFIIGFMWEIRDGVIKNGQGFSIKDLIADVVGILVANLLILIF